jgi:hypothetical protein
MCSAERRRTCVLDEAVVGVTAQVMIRRQPSNVIQRYLVTRGIVVELLNTPVALAEPVVLKVGDFA